MRRVNVIEGNDSEIEETFETRFPVILRRLDPSDIVPLSEFFGETNVPSESPRIRIKLLLRFFRYVTLLTEYSNGH